MGAFDFLAMMTIGQLGMKHPSLAAMVEAVKLAMSREGMHRRFTATAGPYPRRILARSLYLFFRASGDLSHASRNRLKRDAESVQHQAMLHALLYFPQHPLATTFLTLSVFQSLHQVTSGAC